jgi:hypothetical protein
VAPAEQLDKRLKEVLERAEASTAGCTTAQRAALRQQLQGSQWNPTTMLAERGAAASRTRWPCCAG